VYPDLQPNGPFGSNKTTTESTFWKSLRNRTRGRNGGQNDKQIGKDPIAKLTKSCGGTGTGCEIAQKSGGGKVMRKRREVLSGEEVLMRSGLAAGNSCSGRKSLDAERSCIGVLGRRSLGAQVRKRRSLA
jgi:hypothetical protein